LDIAACVGDAGELQQTLHRAILAELAVQNGQYQVQTDRFVLPLFQDKQAVCASVRRQHSRAATAVLPICVRTVTKLPSTALRYPDPERFILLGIEVSCDLLRRYDGDGMFFGTTSE